MALSAGSLNSPNGRDKDSKIIFESQLMIQHLVSLGVDRDRIYGDFMSWDTVSNALIARQFVEAMVALKKLGERHLFDKGVVFKSKNGTVTLRSGLLESKKVDLMTGALNIEVFISDFHADRVKTAFDW